MQRLIQVASDCQQHHKKENKLWNVPISGAKKETSGEKKGSVWDEAGAAAVAGRQSGSCGVWCVRVCVVCLCVCERESVCVYVVCVSARSAVPQRHRPHSPGAACLIVSAKLSLAAKRATASSHLHRA